LAALAAEAGAAPAGRAATPLRRGAGAALMLGAALVGGLGTAYAAGVVDPPWAPDDHPTHQAPAQPTRATPSRSHIQTPPSALPATSDGPSPTPGAAPPTGRHGADGEHSPTVPPTTGCPTELPCGAAPGQQDSSEPGRQDGVHGHRHVTGPGAGNGVPAGPRGSEHPSGAAGAHATHVPHPDGSGQQHNSKIVAGRSL
jgi:hypothetical protein